MIGPFVKMDAGRYRRVGILTHVDPSRGCEGSAQPSTPEWIATSNPEDRQKLFTFTTFAFPSTTMATLTSDLDESEHNSPPSSRHSSQEKPLDIKDFERTTAQLAMKYRKHNRPLLVRDADDGVISHHTDLLNDVPDSEVADNLQSVFVFE
jgi:hypothetical protein